MLLLSRRKDTASSRLTRLSERSLPFQWISLAFCAVWLFATQIPFTHFFATRSAQVHAFVGNVEIPPSFVQTVQNQLGLTSVYKKIGYCMSFLLVLIGRHSFQTLQCDYWPSSLGLRSCLLPLLLVSVFSLLADASPIIALPKTKTKRTDVSF